MTKINVADLRAKTEAAIKAGQEKARLAEAERLAQQKAQEEDFDKKAQRIIRKIPALTEREAAKGASRAVVMKTEYADIERQGNDWRVCKPEWLRRAAKIVYDYCVEAGLKPTLEDDHDGIGVNSWHNIVIHW